MIEYESLNKSNQKFMADLEAAASRVIRSGWYVLGKEVSTFEAEFATYTGAKHCIGVANGLDALILSIEALDLPKASDILVASNTYIATILAIIHAGHRPVLVEPDIKTFNIDPAQLPNALTSNTRAVCVTHLFGKTCRMDEIQLFVETHGLKLIEDCAQSHGAKFAGRMTGTFGDAGCFSFYPTKNLGAIGDAGAVVTNDDNLADRLHYLRNYGSKLKYVNQYIGVNSRLDELQAAMLRVKLQYLSEMTLHKRQMAKLYFEGLATDSDVVLPYLSDDEYDVFHIFGIRHHQRDVLRQYLLNKGIKTEVHYPIPPHKQIAMQGILKGSYPVADVLCSTQLSLPVSFGHSVSEIETVINVIHEFSKINS